MTLDELVIKYGVIGGIRYTEPDKINFLNNIGKDFQELGYEVKILRKDYKRFSGINCYIGDVSNAKNLVIANYDTSKDSFNPDYKYLPFNRKLSERELNEKSKERAIKIILLGAVIMFLGTMYIPFNESVRRIFVLVITVLMTGMAYIFLKGAPSKVSANLNTSGVLGLLELAKDKPKDTAFILTDRFFVDNLGDVMVREALPKTIDNKKVIYLSAIGSGENTVLAYKEGNLKFAKEIASSNRDLDLFELDEHGLLASPLKFYDNAVMITVADKFNDLYEIANVASDEDVKISEEKFNSVVSLVRNYLK